MSEKTSLFSKESATSKLPSVIDVAAYFISKYKDITSEVLDEMKLHKLLYFAQRESLALTGDSIFTETFEGWKFGPVSRDVRNVFCNNEILKKTSDIPDEIKYICNNVILSYGSFSSWKLSEISHNEISWRNARKGLAAGENGDRPMLLSDIKEDAKKVRPYDHTWDMYYEVDKRGLLSYFDSPSKLSSSILVTAAEQNEPTPTTCFSNDNLNS